MKTSLIILFSIVIEAIAAKNIDGKTKRMPLTPTACNDVLTNCNSFGPSICTDDKYRQWAAQNCAKTCQMCTSTTGTGNGGEGNVGTISGSSAGCVYKGQIYQQGQSWKDGCEFSCRCVDGVSGKYTCNKMCFEWKLLPQCHMQPPTAGKCCGKPYCPDGVVINYPLGYIEQ